MILGCHRTPIRSFLEDVVKLGGRLVPGAKRVEGWKRVHLPGLWIRAFQAFECSRRTSQSHMWEGGDGGGSVLGAKGADVFETLGVQVSASFGGLGGKWGLEVRERAGLSHRDTGFSPLAGSLQLRS